MPHLLFLSRPYILVQLVTKNKKALPDSLPQHTSSDNSVSQKVPLKKEKTYPGARYIVI